MLRYRVGGLVLASDRALATLPPVAEDAPIDRVLVREEHRTSLPGELVFELAHRDAPSLAFLTVTRDPTGYRIALRGIGSFLVSPGRISIALDPACSEEALEQALVDQVLPRTMHLEGRPCLHASAAELTPHGAVALCGDSGAGKSTLCAALAARGRLVSDDSLALRSTASGIDALPGYASLRLWPDAARALVAAPDALARATPRGPKLRLPSSLVDAPVPLARVVLLERSADAGTAPSLSPLHGSAAFEQLQRHVHRLAPDHPVALAGEFSLLSSIVERVPIVRLRFRPALEDLERVADLIEASLRG